MKLSLTIKSERKNYQYGYGASSKPQVEEYDRIAVTEFSGNARTIAGTLRAIADDLDPMVPDMTASIAFDEVSE